MEEKTEKNIEVEVEAGDSRVFYIEKGLEAFEKSLAKKGFVGERGFRGIMLPFKEEFESWEKVCKQLEPGRRALVKEFYANLGDRKNLTCYITGRWVPFGERAISQVLTLKPGGDCTEYKQLQKSPNFEEITRELTEGQGEREKNQDYLQRLSEPRRSDIK